MMRREEAFRLFGLNNLAIEAEVQRIERKFKVDLGHQRSAKPQFDETYFPQFAERLRNEANQMANNYIIFYCLENSIRDLISQRLEEAYGEEWWSRGVPDVVHKNAEKNKKKELQSGVSLRSSDLIDFTTFGELGEIIKLNSDVFGDMFSDVQAVQKILATLNTLRAPIAHCKPLAEDEELRLYLGLRDWFRQME